MKSRWLEKWRGGVLPLGLNSALMIGAALLAPAATYARVPYASARQSDTQGRTASKSLPAESADEKQIAGGCESGRCVQPVRDLSPASADDHHYGTELTWVDTPREAGKLAEAKHKLAFVIQLSGDFTRDEFT